MCKEFFTNPMSMITRAKKNKDMNYTLKILFIEWLLFGLGSFIVFSIFFKTTYWLITATSVFITVFLIGIASTILIGWVMKLIIVTLGGKGKYFEGLTPCVFGLFPISIGFVFSSIISFIPVIGFIVSFILILLFSALGISIFYKGLKEMFGTDMITTWIGVGILFVGISLAFYLSMALSMFAMSSYMESFPLFFQRIGCPSY